MLIEHSESLLWEYGTKSPSELYKGLSYSRSYPQTCTDLSAAPKVDYARRSIMNAPSYIQVLWGAPENTLVESQSTLLRARGPASIWKYFKALVWSTWLPGRFACGFRTDLHFADVRDIVLTPAAVAHDARHQRFVAKLARACGGSMSKECYDYFTLGAP